MGRRFALSTEVAFVGTLAGIVLGWVGVGKWESIDRPEWWLAAGTPSMSALLLMGLILAVPPVTQGSNLRRPLTVTLPALHAALTAMLARALVTGPVAVATPASLRPIEVWLSIPLLILLFVIEVVSLEFLLAFGRRSKPTREGLDS